eukprot:1328793-Pyramimonas_sp.AAC.1
MRELESEDPYLTIVPFSFDARSAINNFFPPEERRRRRAKAFEHVQFAHAIVRHRMEHGRHVLLEKPLMFTREEYLKDELPPGLVRVRRDQSALDLRDYRGDLLQKPTIFVTSAVALAYAHEVRCSREHGHGQVQGRGGKSREFFMWATDMAERILEVVKQQYEFEKLLGGETILGVPGT